MQAKVGSYELVFGFLCHTKRDSYDRLFASYGLGMRIRTQKRAKDTRANPKRDHETGSDIARFAKCIRFDVSIRLAGLKGEMCRKR